MGLFDKLFKGLGEITSGVLDEVIKDDVTNQPKAAETPAIQPKKIVLSSSSHIVKEDFLDSVVSFSLNDAFKPAKSHACEGSMLFTYAPNEEYGSEGSYPYIAIQDDDDIFEAVCEFEENGTFEDAVEIHPLSGKFLFKAKKDYYDDIIYFYGFASDDGFWDKAGLCMVYPKEYVGTDDERKLMQVLDEAAESFEETKTAFAD